MSEAMNRDSASIAVVHRYLEHWAGDVNNIPWRVASKLRADGFFDFNLEGGLVGAPEFARAIERIRLNGASALMPLGDGDKPGTTKVFEVSEALSSMNLEDAEFIIVPLTKRIEEVSSSLALRSLIARYKSALSSRNDRLLLSIAAELHLALEKDWEWQVEVLSDAVKWNLTDIINRQLDRLMWQDPAQQSFTEYMRVSFLDAVAVISSGAKDLLAPEKQKKYEVALSHLPWKSDVGFASLIGSSKGVSQQDNWKIAESWLATFSPGLWFQAWLAAVAHPTTVPEHLWVPLWERIAVFREPMEGDASFISSGQFRLYRTITEFFFCRIEAAIPNVRADLAIWCASHLAQSISRTLENLDPSQDPLEGIEEALKVAKGSWNIVARDAPFSSLRTAFLTFGNCFAPAIQASIPEWFENRTSIHIPDENRTQLISLVKLASVGVFKFQDSDVGNIDSNIIGNLLVVRAQWKDVLPEDEVARYINANEEISALCKDSDKLLLRMSEPFGKEGDDIEGMLAIRAWATMLAQRKLNINDAADLVCSQRWSEFIEPTLAEEELQIVLSALLTSNWWEGRPAIFVELPHWAAKQCIALADEQSRRTLYYWTAAMYCLHGGTTSAMALLSHGDVGRSLNKDRERLRVYLLMILEKAPAWVQGKIRSMLTTLAD